MNVKNFIVVLTLLNFSYTCYFSFSPFLMSLIARIFLVILVSFLRKTFYDTWKCHYKQLHLILMIFNRKPLVIISSISNSKNASWNLLSFASRIVVNECLRNSVRICFSFVLISNKTIKTLGFRNNTYYLDLPSLDMLYRDEYRTLQTSKIERCVKIVNAF